MAGVETRDFDSPDETRTPDKTQVDVVRIVFFAYGAYLVWEYSSLISEERMTMIDLPKSIVFYTVVVAFALMCVRSVQVLIENVRQGHSVLTHPEAYMPAGE